MEIALFIIGVWAGHVIVTRVVRLARENRAPRARTQVQTGGDGAVQVQTGGDYSATRQLTAAADDLTRRLNDHPTHVGTGLRLPVRNGGPFRAVTACPACGHYAAHPIRQPNPEPPTTEDVRDLHGRTVARYLPRWDERPYETVRTCAAPDCRWEWGHATNPTRPEDAQ